MQTSRTMKIFKKLASPVLAISGLCILMTSGLALADVTTSGIALSEIASNVNTSVSELATVLSDISLIAGIGFVLASFFKFHQHKLNPTQVPISQGITLLLIGAGLTLFPVMLPTAKRAIFGSQAPISQVGGTEISKIIGSGSAQ